MLEVIAKRGRRGIYSIAAQGHTGFADSGSDIVCAAVSTLMQALWTGLEDVLQLRSLQAVQDPEVPYMARIWEESSREAQYIARTILLSLQAIAESYPDYVLICELVEEENGYDDEQKI